MTFKTRILEFYRSQAFKITVKVSDCIIIRLFSFFCFFLFVGPLFDISFLAGHPG